MVFIVNFPKYTHKPKSMPNNMRVNNLYYLDITPDQHSEKE